MGNSQSTLIEKFEEGAEKGKASNMFIDGDILYSYGYHFPLAIRFENGTYLLNGDKYSVSTSAHQSQCFHMGPQIPFSALNAANILPQNARIVDNTSDSYREVPYVNDKGEQKIRTEHLLGAILIESKGKYYLSGIDSQESWARRAYFLCQLPGKPKTVQAAYESLMPKRVKAAIDSGAEVKRQGEWFFIPCPEVETRTLPRPSLAIPKPGNMRPLTFYKNGDNSYPRYGGPVECKGYAAGNHFAICSGKQGFPSYTAWTIVHLPTGSYLKIVHGKTAAEGKRIAAEAVRRLEALPHDWATFDKTELADDKQARKDVALIFADLTARSNMNTLEADSTHFVTEKRHKAGAAYVRGTVRQESGQHAMLSLGNVWHKPVKNAAVGS